jgi:hypothetical protein
MESNAMNDWEEKKKQLMQTSVFRDMPEYVVGEVAKVVEAKTVSRGTERPCSGKETFGRFFG